MSQQGRVRKAFLSVLQRRSMRAALFVYTWVASDLLNGWAQRQTHLRLVQTALGHEGPPGLHMQAGSFTLGPGLSALGPCVDF